MTELAIYPGLARLRLSEDDLRALVEQGAVCQERRRGHSRYKLRFRAASERQIVRYIPSPMVELVRDDLDRLQADRQAASALREVTRRIRQARRDAKRQLQPVLDALGYHFHGTSIRRRRHPQVTMSFTIKSPP